MDKERTRETKAIIAQSWQRGIRVSVNSLCKPLTNLLKYGIIHYEKQKKSNRKTTENEPVS
jgi:hypothetical protein